MSSIKYFWHGLTLGLSFSISMYLSNKDKNYKIDQYSIVYQENIKALQEMHDKEINELKKKYNIN